MDSKQIDKFFFNEQLEKDTWSRCVFVFDTSALLNFYSYSQQTKDHLFNKVFTVLKGRLWIPYNVEFEYLKNRKKTQQKPIKEKYGVVEQEFEDLILYTEKLENVLRSIKNRTKKKFSHPYVDDKIFISISESMQGVKSSLDELKNVFKEELLKRRKEISETEQNDDVNEAIENHFEVGPPYDFNRLLEISAQGEFRYRNKIAPGFEDYEKKEGFQKYGDLIIWNQVLDFGRQKRSPIVFVTDDVKLDWCYAHKASGEARIVRPKEELVQEFNESTGSYFWMFTLSQFIHNLEKYDSIKFSEAVISDIEENSSDSLIVFNAIYFHQNTGYQDLVKFFEDGEVQYVRLGGGDIRDESVQKKVNRWFVKGREGSSSNYLRKGNEISFSIEIIPGIATYSGKVEKDQLILVSRFSLKHGNDEDEVETQIFDLISKSLS